MLSNLRAKGTRMQIALLRVATSVAAQILGLLAIAAAVAACHSIGSTIVFWRGDCHACILREDRRRCGVQFCIDRNLPVWHSRPASCRLPSLGHAVAMAWSAVRYSIRPRLFRKWASNGVA
jgi:hypothetical protein